MIFYFSGTGNSLQAAKSIAEYQGDRLVSIAALMSKSREKYEFELKENEAVGFVYPVYAWGPPSMVLQFIDKLKFTNYADHFIYSLATCGDNIGNTMKLLERALKRNGLTLDSGFSVRMPNNYIITYDVDPKELENEKLVMAEKTLGKINKVIAERQKGVFDVVKGFMPGLLTSVVNPLFSKYAMGASKFYATDHCTGCGVCEKICNCRNIKLVEGSGKQQKRPVWGSECAQCLACLHYCPTRAIQYGKGTEKKNRYTNPNVRVAEMYMSDSP